MNNKNVYFLSKILLIFSCCILLFLMGQGLIYNNYFYRVNKSDIYLMDRFNGNDDPFFESFIDTVEVINIEDNYIQYINLRYNDTTSMHQVLFNNYIILPKLK